MESALNNALELPFVVAVRLLLLLLVLLLVIVVVVIIVAIALTSWACFTRYHLSHQITINESGGSRKAENQLPLLTALIP